jgi:hypothetical protein
MIRSIAVSFLVAIPGPLLADPIPKDVREIPKIKGTTWTGTDSMETVMTCTFCDDGTLEYTSTHKGGMPTTYRNGTWKQDGKNVSWEMNQHYADYTGTVAKGKMEIAAKNVTGLTWTLTLKPVPAKVEKKP